MSKQQLRDEFAKSALIAIGAYYNGQRSMDISEVVKKAFNIADMMIKERENHECKWEETLKGGMLYGEALLKECVLCGKTKQK